MSLFIELHLIQNFAPSNLNRDDTGAPKDALFGGHRRARVSSQCFKRAARLKAGEMSYIPAENQGVRTRKLKSLLEKQLVDLGHSESTVQVEAALAASGLKLKDDGKTEYLLFLGEGEIFALAKTIHEHWDKLSVTVPAGEKKNKNKKDAKAASPEGLGKAMKAILNGQKAVDVALFGRMLADMPEVNQDAACQVAHALSTHRVEREFDYFTAVDDKADANEASAGMIGQVEFNSATFYRYAVIDVNKLTSNLGGDRELALTGIRAFVQAIARAIPTGKQNTFAAHNPPAFVGVTVRRGSPFNLANAFEKPVWPRHDKELSSLSIERLAAHDDSVVAAYGDGRDEWAYLDLSGSWPSAKGDKQQNLDALANWAVSRAQAALEV